MAQTTVDQSSAHFVEAPVGSHAESNCSAFLQPCLPSSLCHVVAVGAAVLSGVGHSQCHHL